MTNKDIFQTIGSSKENFRMTKAESQDIKAALMAHMKANPVKQKNSFFASLMRPMRMAVSTLSVVLVAGVGVSYAAEASLPGDLLYPVKVNVVEEVVSTLKINKEAKATYEVERAEKRIEEAIELAETGDLNSELEAKVWGQLEQQAQKVEDLVVKLEENEEIIESQAIQNNWNKLIVENQPIVIQLVQEAPVVLEEPVMDALPELETPELIQVVEPVIEVLPTIEPLIEVEPVVEIEVIEVAPEIVEPVIEVLPAIEPVIEVEPVVEIEVIEVAPEIVEPKIEVLPEVKEPELIEVLEPIIEPIIEVKPPEEIKPEVMNSGLLFDLNGEL